MLAKLWLILCTIHLYNCNLILNPKITTTIEQCVTRLQLQQFNDHIVIVSSNYDIRSNLSVVQFSDRLLSVPQKLWKFNHFLIELNHFKNFEMILKGLFGTQLWNSRAKYLVGYHGSKSDLSNIFQVSWLYYIFNIAVIVQENTNTNVYTYFPYKNSCGNLELELLGECNSDLVTFPEKIPFDLNGCGVRLMAYPMIPYVINLKAPREKSAQAGVEVTMINVLSQRMNFTEVYIPHQHKYWGFKDSNRTYQFMFGSLFRNECDVVIGMQFGNASHTVDFDAGFVHLLDASVWWAPVALPIPQWKNIAAIFQANVWLTIFITFLINGIAWWLVGRNKESTDDYNDWVLCIMSSLYSLLQGSVEFPTNWRLRGIFILWLMTCLLIFTAYQSQLVSILTSPLYEHQIDNMAEVVHSKLGWGMFIGAALAYEDPTNWVHVEVMKKFYVCPLSNYCMNRTAFDRDFVALRNLRNARYFLPRYYTSPNGKLMVYQLQDNRLGIWVRFHMRKGLPFLDRFNSLIMLMESAGFIGKWDKDIGFFIRTVQSEPDHEPLSINHLQAGFYILSIGLSVAIFVFCSELIHGRCKKR